MAVVQSVVHDRKELQAALHEQMVAFHLDENSRRLCNKICYGYFRYRLRIQWFLSTFLKNPEKLPERFRDTLGLAVLEMAFLDAIPDYAAVSWAVSAIKSLFGQRLGAVANGVLRNVGRSHGLFFDDALYRKRLPGKREFLSIRYSCPLWIVDILLHHYDEESAMLYLKAFLEEPPLGLRFNPRHEQYETRHGDVVRDMTVVEEQGAAMAVRGQHTSSIGAYENDGVLSRQSFASYQALHSLEPDTFRKPVYDICAGRGGKTCALLEQGISPIVASDSSWSRLRQLPRELQRLQLESIPLFVADNAQYPAFGSTPKTILADIPCSGLGVLSRRPDGKLVTPNFPKLLKTQRHLLSKGMEMLPPGGVLAIITCTLNPDENMAHVDYLKDAFSCTLKSVWQTPASSPLCEFFWTATVERN